MILYAGPTHDRRPVLEIQTHGFQGIGKLGTPFGKLIESVFLPMPVVKLAPKGRAFACTPPGAFMNHIEIIVISVEEFPRLLPFEFLPSLPAGP